MTAMRELAIQRIPLQKYVITGLLQTSTLPRLLFVDNIQFYMLEKMPRSASIVTLRKIIAETDETVEHHIETSASQSLSVIISIRALAGQNVTSDYQTGNITDNMIDHEKLFTEQDVLRHLELFLSLCIRNQRLLFRFVCIRPCQFHRILDYVTFLQNVAKMSKTLLLPTFHL